MGLNEVERRPRLIPGGGAGCCAKVELLCSNGAEGGETQAENRSWREEMISMRQRMGRNEERLRRLHQGQRIHVHETGGLGDFPSLEVGHCSGEDSCEERALWGFQEELEAMLLL